MTTKSLAEFWFPSLFGSLVSFICLISLVSESRIGVLGSVSCARSHRMVKRKGVAALREKVLYLSLVLILEGFGCYLETGLAWPIPLLKLRN